MSNLPPDIKARRAIEDRAAKLGAERAALQQKSAANTHAMIDLLRDAKGTGIPYEQMATLLGVTRQTVFNWRETADQLAPGESSAEHSPKPQGNWKRHRDV